MTATAAATTDVARPRRWPLVATLVPGLALAPLVDLRAAPLAVALAVVVGVLQQALP